MHYLTIAAFALLFSFMGGIAMAAEPDMICVKGGTFTMGSPANEISRGKEEVQRQVTLPDYFIGKYAITQKEYRDATGDAPSNFSGDNLPVENVTWFEAVRFCNALSEKQGLTPAYAITGEGDAAAVR